MYRTCPVHKPHALALAVGAALLPLAVQASEVRLPRIDVIGETEQDVARQPGAVTIVTREELAATQPMSTEDALRGVPGVMIKKEEESGIVANIGIRGLSAADYKSLILEDGVPVAPGLFVGNGRYYNPRIQRMESIEVLKGAASLRYGPNTIGGVINYKTKQPEDGVTVGARVGGFGYREAVLEAGGSAPSGEATAGVVYTRARSDGFQNKGFQMEDLMLKGGMLVGDKHWISAKVTHYDNEANISYRGQFLDAFNAGATFNPAPDDWYLTTRKSLDINHEWEIDSSRTLNTLLYWSEMNRDYWRFNTVSGTPTQTVNGLTQWNYSDNVDGNNRSFERIGLDSRLHVQHDRFGMSNEAELGFRYMEEEMIDQTLRATRERPRTPVNGLGRDRVDDATSYALFAQNRFIVNHRLSITPGIRVEKYEQTRLDRRISAADGNFATTSNTEYVPGVGFTFQATPMAQFYGGIYKAFSPALNGDSLSGLEDQQLEAERSVNLEIGVRGGADRLRYELTAFRMQFDNQIIPANSNSDFQNTNGGKTLHQGLEAAIGYDFGNGFNIDANATYVPTAKFDGHRYEPDGVTIDIPDGNRVTYTPELVANLRLGYRTGKLSTALSANYVSSQYTDTDNTRAIQENTSGFFTGRLDSYTTVDLTANYDVNRQFSLSAAVKNLTDEHYMASLRQGIYAGPSRSFELGARYKF